MSDAPTKYVEIEQKLGEPLASLIAERRTEGVSWRRIAGELRERTEIRVSHEALRMWTEGRAPVAAVPPGTPGPSTPPPTPKPPGGPGRRERVAATT